MIARHAGIGAVIALIAVAGANAGANSPTTQAHTAFVAADFVTEVPHRVLRAFARSLQAAGEVVLDHALDTLGDAAAHLKQF